MSSDIALLDRKAVESITSLSKAAIYKYIKRGTFPRPIQVMPDSRAVRWLKAEVLDFVEQRNDAPRRGTVASHMEAVRAREKANASPPRGANAKKPPKPLQSRKRKQRISYQAGSS